MSLSLNVRQYRLDHHISQEYVAEKLFMCQPNYSRIEKSDVACAKRITQIADAMGTTPETLENYHVVQTETGQLIPADWVCEELVQRHETIKHQQQTIKIQNTYIRYMHSVMTTYSLNVGKSLNKPPTLPNDAE